VGHDDEGWLGSSASSTNLLNYRVFWNYEFRCPTSASGKTFTSAEASNLYDRAFLVGFGMGSRDVLLVQLVEKPYFSSSLTTESSCKKRSIFLAENAALTANARIAKRKSLAEIYS
jgi:hypothetical protein